MGTKIMVVQLKELVKTALFAVIGLILIIMLVYFFLPKAEEPQAQYKPGTYTASIILNDEPMSVAVTVTDKEITAIEINAMGDTQEVFYPLVKPTMSVLAEDIIAKQSLDVDIPSGAEVTSSVLLEAVSEALNIAALNME